MPPTPANPIDIYYPNGGNLAVQLYVFDTGSNQPVLWNGASTFSGTISIGTISGSKSNNAGVPGSTNLGTLPAICTTVSAGYTEGNQVALVTDTTGALKVSVANTVTVSGSITPTVAYSNGSVSSTTQRVVNAVSTPYSKAALTNVVNTISSVAGVLTGYYIYNPNSSAAYVQIFDTSSATMGSTTPKWSVGIPATSAANLAGLRLNFGTAILIGASTTFSGSTAPTTGLDVNFSYE